jgi:hypothetical protein
MLKIQKWECDFWIDCRPPTYSSTCFSVEIIKLIQPNSAVNTEVGVRLFVCNPVLPFLVALPLFILIFFVVKNSKGFKTGCAIQNKWECDIKLIGPPSYLLLTPSSTTKPYCKSRSGRAIILTNLSNGAYNIRFFRDSLNSYL